MGGRPTHRRGGVNGFALWRDSLHCAETLMPARAPTALRSKPLEPTTLRFGSRAEQVAQFLRGRIASGEIAAPLPGTRRWSKELGVSRSTLDAALKLLAHAQVVRITRQGVQLRKARRSAGATAIRPRLRWLMLSNPQHHAANYLTLTGVLQERMRLKGVQVTWETGTAARLREIARRAAPPGELCLLASLPPSIQQAFAVAGRPTLVVGEVAAGVALPFVSADFTGTVRHAAFQLLRDGCRHLIMWHVRGKAVGLQRARAGFAKAAGEWSVQPISVRYVDCALDRGSLQAAARRLAGGVVERTGIVVIAPLPVTMVAGALAQAGRKIPAQVSLAAVFQADEGVQSYQPLLHYPWPLPAILARITSIAEAFVANGRLPSGGFFAPTTLQRLA